MFDEIKIFAQVGDGLLPKKLNELGGIYKNFILIKSSNNVHYFIGERTYGESFNNLYQSVENNMLSV